MVSPYHQSSFDSLKRDVSTTITNTDGSTSTTVITSLKSPSPTRKNRIPSQNQTSRKNLVDDLRTVRTQSSTNRMSNKLPNLQSIASESTRSRFDNQTSKAFLPSTPGKLERQLTSINPSNRLPTLYSLFNPDDQKRIANLRRRQIYALNHLMREFEQEQFRQYCQLHNIGDVQTDANAITDDSQSSAPTST